MDMWQEMMSYMIELEIKHLSNPNAFEEELTNIKEEMKKTKKKQMKEDLENKLLLLQHHLTRFDQLSNSSISPVAAAPAPAPEEKKKTNQTQKICPPGKQINPNSGRCIKIKTQKVCPPGKKLNPKTRRCIKD